MLACPCRHYPDVVDAAAVAVAFAVAVAAVGAAAWWFMYCEDGPQISYYQLVNYTLLV